MFILLYVLHILFLAPSVAPSNLSGFAIDHASIMLHWVAPPSNTLNGILALYVVRVTERETGLVFEYNATNTSIMLTPLHPDYVYECSVAAYTNDVGPFSRIFAVQALMSGMFTSSACVFRFD